MLNKFTKLLKEVKQFNQHLSHSQAIAVTKIIFKEEKNEAVIDFKSLVNDFWTAHNEAKNTADTSKIYSANSKKIAICTKIYDAIFKENNETLNDEFSVAAGKFASYILQHKLGYLSPVFGSRKIDARIKFLNN
jgi:hypothetical protein